MPECFNIIIEMICLNKVTENDYNLHPLPYALIKVALCTNSTRVRRNDADFSTFAGTKNKIILKRLTE
jgi:hypothetical protein